MNELKELIEKTLTPEELAGLRRTHVRLSELIEQWKPNAIRARYAAAKLQIKSTRWLDDYESMIQTVSAINKLIGE